MKNINLTNITGAFFVSLLLLIATGIPASGAQRGYSINEIKYPAFSQPAFVLAGESFNVKILSPSAGALSSLSLIDFKSGETVIELLSDTRLEAGMNKLEAAIPDSLAPAMYNLCATMVLEETVTDCQPHSVVVKESMDAPFRFVQITDFHMGDPRAEKQFEGVDMHKVRMAALEAANAEKPDFVLFTGDVNSYAVSYETDYPKSVAMIVDNLEYPAIIIPGNHDHYNLTDDDGNPIIDGVELWPEYFGAMHQALDYGGFRFICFNTYGWNADTRNYNKTVHLQSGTTHTFQGTLTKDEYRWVVGALKSAGDLVPVFVGHHGPRQFEPVPQQWCDDCISYSKMMSLLRKGNVPYFIYGHIHRNEEYTEGSTHFVSTTSTGSDVAADDLWAIRTFDAKPDGTIENNVVTLFEEPPMKE